MPFDFYLGSAFLRRVCSSFSAADSVHSDFDDTWVASIPASVVIPAIAPDTIPAHIQTWCDEHGYSEPQLCDLQWWAFPPNGVMPEPIRDRLPSGEYTIY